MTIIDELKQLSVYLTDLETDLTMFFHRSLDLLAIVDANGVFLKTSSAWLPILGYNAEDLVGKSCKLLAHPDDVIKIDESLGTLKESDVPKVLIRMRTAFNAYRLISWSASKSRNNKIYSIGRDVTEVYDRIANLEAQVKELKKNE